jgi:CBS domain-containing protein
MKRQTSRVADILEFKSLPVQTIKGDETIGNLSRRLQKERIGAMIVSDDGETISGIISERDIAYALSTYRRHLHELPVSALMTKKVITCSPEDKVPEVARIMSEFHIRHVPVVRDDKIVGVIGMRDVVQQRLEDIQRNVRLMSRIVGAS